MQTCIYGTSRGEYVPVHTYDDKVTRGNMYDGIGTLPNTEH